ncbi:cadherin-related tumor suppressor [Bacillus rossius redtenbacheri]|uniref:cadherin-related tumor suppressor n=1 Tax=Bacillus rossius redtenbacheri TaxID=93214 RepID=UPI002FDED980
MGNSKTKKVTDTNDNPPVFSAAAYSFDVPEDAARGAEAGRVEARDLDQGVNGHVTYTVISDWGNDVFSLNPQSGAFSLAARLDYEEVQHYIFVVQAQDSGRPSLSSTATVYFNVVDLNDNAPLFDPMSYSDEVLENVTAGSAVLAVSATDLDSGFNGRIEYSIAAGDEQGNFGIAPNGTVFTARALDRETSSLHNLVVMARDQARPPQTPLSATVQVTIVVRDVNDNSPEFVSPNRTAVAENTPANTVVMVVKATDRDEGRNSYVEYSLAPDPMFSLGPADGLLRVTGRLDRESRSSYTLWVTAKDRGSPPRVTRLAVLVVVTDENDNSPVFDPRQYSASVPENASIGASVLQVSATDVDEGANGRLRYSIAAGDDNRDFSIGEDTGVLRVAKNLDFERRARYVLTVRAQDRAGAAADDDDSSVSSAPRFDVATVAVQVSDVNDNPPVFLDSPYLAHVVEGVVPPRVCRVRAHDADSPPHNDQVRYFLKEGGADLFRVDAATGDISLQRALDREQRAEYLLSVVAMDTGSPPLTGSGTVRVVVQDVNDHSPQFERQSYSASALTECRRVSAGSPPLTGSGTVRVVVQDVNDHSPQFERQSYSATALTECRRVSAGSPPLTGSGTVRVVVQDVNDHSPQFERQSYSASALTECRRVSAGSPPLTGSGTVRVVVQDVNDHSPQFERQSYSASALTECRRVSAGSPPLTGSGTVRVVVQDVNDHSPQFERQSYSASALTECRRVSAGSPPLTGSGTVRVVVQDVNDHSPQFERQSYSASALTECRRVSAGSPPLTGSGTVRVVVQDVNDHSPQFERQSYSATALTECRRVSAGSPPLTGSGTVRVVVQDVNDHSPQFERQSYSASALTECRRVSAGSPPLTGSGTVRVVVQDVNDHSPQFECQSYSASVPENLPAGSPVLRPVASDRDEGLNARIRYSLLGENADRFAVDPDSGLVTTAAPLDRERAARYHLTLVARDSSEAEPRASAVNLTVLVLDDNDNSPSFSAERYAVHVPDRTQPGQFVFGAKAVDADIDDNSRIVFSLAGADEAKFTIDEKTGVIKAAKELRGERPFRLQVKATDSGAEPRAALALLDVYLRPGELFPTVSAPQKLFTLPEDAAAGQTLTQLSASSPKAGPTGRVRFRVAGGNAGDALRVDPLTGEVLVAGAGLDYEAARRYVVWAEARDSDIPPLGSVLQLVIDVTDANDNAPVLDSSLYNATIMEEESPPQTVITIRATDPDSGVNGEVTYRLVSDEEGTFEMDERSGQISTAARLDRETTDGYRLVVEAVDGGSPRLTGSATVLVTVLDRNDNPPRFTRLFSVNVTENSEPGAFVIQVTSSDLDEGENANASYILADNPGGKFVIDPLTGNVTVAGPLDREMQDEYLLKVAAVDGSWRAETPLTITIMDQNDNAPEFERASYSFNFPELQHRAVFVGQVAATDRDKQGPNSIISYSLKHPSDLFTVDPASGELFSKRSLRYKHTALESSPENQYILTVMATDNGKPPMSSECLVTINVVDANNNPPQFERRDYFSPVPEEASVGLQVVKMLARDDKDFGVNAEIEYLKTGGNGSELFDVGRTSGWITVAQPLAGRLLQYHTLNVRAIDKGVPPRHDDVAVTLVVTGENKFTPVFTALSYQVIVPENEPVGSPILTVAASDDDEGPNGMVRYSISSGNERYEFSVEAASGAVIIGKPLDYDTVQEYRLNITARDLGFESHEATATLTITLTDINDNAPVFNQTSYDAFLPENMPPKSFVYRLQAHDADSPKNAIIQYSIIGGSGKDVFSIEPKTGEILSKDSFDFEEKNLYLLDILAANPDSPMFGSTKVQVHITGRNEFYPHFMQPVFHYDVSESAEVGTSIGMIQATDQDAGEDGKVYYLFVGSSNDRGFTIKSDTGEIRVARHLDRETQSRVVLTVMAKNAGGIRGNDTDEAQVIVTVQDGNDPPEFLQAEYDGEVSEGAAAGTQIVQVKAVDKDVRPQNNQFSYSIIGGNIGHVFKVDPQTGEVETTSRLDRETSAEYLLTVGAIDTGTPPQTGTTMVRISVSDINDNGPVLDPLITVGYVSENEPPGTSIITLAATDPDLPPNGAPFTFQLAGGRHLDMVSVEKHTGVVKTTKILDREQTPKLEIMVEIEDSGQPRMRSQHPVSIVVLDQNDSPSTPRSVHVIVNTFNNVSPLGRIADVHPNDPDTTGDYHCRLVGSIPPRGAPLAIPSGCHLHTSKVVPGASYSLSVSGNDGRHADVVSSVTVEYVPFDNSTVQNSITLRIENMTASKFLALFFKGFVDILKSAFASGDAPHLYALHEVKKGLELSVAVKGAKGYEKQARVSDAIAKKRSSLQEMLQPSAVVVGYSPCQQADACDNGGYCTEGIRVHADETTVTDSEAVVFTSPLVSHDFSCRCAEGFTGKRCDRRQDPCSPDPCLHGATCRRLGHDFQCACPPLREGRLCETERGDVCDGSPCQNGGSCRESPDGSSFFCLCRPGYRGNRCEAAADSCRPNPCMHGGLCVSLKPGYKCSCPEARYGRHCERSTFGFRPLSFMAFPPLDPATNDVSVVFSTTKPDALLVYNFGHQTGGRSDFVAVQLVAGRAMFSYGGARTAITAVTVASRSLSDGEWHKVTATRNGRVVSLSVSNCTDSGDVCQECRPGDNTCYADDVGPAGTLNFNNQPMYVGGVPSANPVLERPGQVSSDDLVGCVHGVSVNGRALNLSAPLQSRDVDPTCGRARGGPCRARAPCGGDCLDRWGHAECSCGPLLAPDCDRALGPVHVGPGGGFAEFPVSEQHRRMQLLEAVYRGSSRWEREPGVPGGSPAPKSLGVTFRTWRPDGLLLYSATHKDYTSVELRGGRLVYVSRLGAARSPVNMTAGGGEDEGGPGLADGRWHNVTLHAHPARGVRLLVDGARVGDELELAGVHDFLDAYLTALSAGGARPGLPGALPASDFEGCLANFSVNYEIQPFNGSGSIFPTVILHGAVSPGCVGPAGVGTAAARDPLSIGITLVIVFFVILLVGILVSFVVFRLRRQNREKKGGGPGHTKQNGGAALGAGGEGGVLGRALHAEGGNVGGFLPDNGDVMRSVGGGHHLVGPELISKKYKEREIVAAEPRPQRPDIIEREVVNKSMQMREEHHPPLPPPAQPSQGAADLEVPEHYDLENASSIAPSDIDIVFHYKGYREGGNVRKYKAAPPHLPPPNTGYHHKHQGAQQSQHRHSPHGYSPRTVVPPPPVNRVDSPSAAANAAASNGKLALQHQSTPLARLSPSSELSSQQAPRILTLQDISGKPLQSALLATTSSSGGVGKDALRSNSERSLNSPVMSQLSGRSSSAGGKSPGDATAPPMGLTAEEIERLNSRPRTSSLVSTLDAVSSSSEAPRARGRLLEPGGGAPAPLHHRVDLPDARLDRDSSTTTDESGNDSFTCSEFEYDNTDKRGDDTDRGVDTSGGGGKPPLPPVPVAYDGFDSSFRGSLSTLVASDDDLSTHMGAPLYRPHNGSPSSTAALGWDYLLNWGPNFESLVGVFKDIAELPDSVNPRGAGSLRLTNSAPKPSEEYV